MDFRSSKSIELLKEADIVVTNPPFSLFLDYMKNLINNNKKYLILAPYTAIYSNYIFKYIKIRSLSVGVNKITNFTNFDKKKYKVNACWLTNLPSNKSINFIELNNKYCPNEYPTYYNFNAIEVNNLNRIPSDFYGYMGVPGSFLSNWHPDQFELIGIGRTKLGRDIGVGGYDINHSKYFEDNFGVKYLRKGTVYFLKNGIPKIPFVRIIIKRKK